MLEDYDSVKELLTKAQRRAPKDMPIAEKLRSLEDNLVRERNNEKALYNIYEHVQTSRDVKRKQVEGEFYSTILQDLELFWNSRSKK